MINKPFYGFLETIDAASRPRAIKFLSETVSSSIANAMSAKNLVEKIVKRDGLLLTADEARSVAPFEIEHNDVFIACYPCEKTDVTQTKTGMCWCALNVAQYCYGIYLRKLIANGTINVTDINEIAYA